MGNIDIKGFDVIFGFDMETDIGSFTPFYEGVKYGTLNILRTLEKHNIFATFFWTGHAAENNPEMVKYVANGGHEIGCHGLYHETLGDPLFPLPNNMPILESEIEGRLKLATKIVYETSGIQPLSFRCPRLWGSTKVINVLEDLGYIADASYPLYFYRKPFIPYHPSVDDWTKEGSLQILEIPNFCDLIMESKDEFQRDRDQWPLFRTESANALIKKVESYLELVWSTGNRPVLCFYLHPWEFHPMPQGDLDFGECSVRPQPFIVKNCGDFATNQFDQLCSLLAEKGARFITSGALAREY